MRQAKIIITVLEQGKRVNTAVDIQGTMTQIGMLQAMLTLAHSLSNITKREYHQSVNDVKEEGH